MKRIEIFGKWNTAAGAIRALNREINKRVGYNGNYFDIAWFSAHLDKYGELFDGCESGYINICNNSDGIYNYAYAAIPD